MSFFWADIRGPKLTSYDVFIEALAVAGVHWASGGVQPRISFKGRFISGFWGFFFVNTATLREKVFALFHIRASSDSQITAVSIRFKAASKMERPTEFFFFF